MKTEESSSPQKTFKKYYLASKVLFQPHPEGLSSGRKESIMTFTSVHDLSQFINSNHTSFAGHRITSMCANVRTFDTIMRSMSYLNKENAAKSVTFDAKLYANGASIPTQITIGIADNGFSYSEQVIH